MAEEPIPSPSPSRQIGFHQLLVAARKTWLSDALSAAVGRLDLERLKDEIMEYVPQSAQQALAQAGIRDEMVFPTPVVLGTAPTLVGYYRLLLGIPRKSFYRAGTGMGQFESMEETGTLNDRQRSRLPNFCRAMCSALADLVGQISPTVTARDIQELQLLTLGSFFQGGRNNIIGKQATEDVFLSIKEIVRTHLSEDEARRMVIKNAAGRLVSLTLGSDPDIEIEEDVSGTIRRKVAIEIKGGTDQSNAHNRAGEAEKSHQKAKRKGFLDFWTIIAKKGVDVDQLKEESPTTNSWFDVAHILGRQGADWDEFRSRLVEVVGIPAGRGHARAKRR